MRPCEPCVHTASLRNYLRGNFMYILYYSRTSGNDGRSRNYRPPHRYYTDASDTVCAPFEIRKGIRLIKQAVKQHKKTAQQKLRRLLFNAKQIILRSSHQRQALYLIRLPKGPLYAPILYMTMCWSRKKAQLSFRNIKQYPPARQSSARHCQ